MMNKLSGLMVFFFSMQAFASDTINIIVKTTEERTAAIGFSVDGKKSGSRGKVHSGKGPVNKSYLFGYRKDSALSADILCGTRTLTKDSTVTIIVTENRCSILVN
jgi:hypothetical protein